MAKKTAPKKKSATVKEKVAKSSKPAKTVKTVAKADKSAKKAKKPVPAKAGKAKPKDMKVSETVKPALMTKKGKISEPKAEAAEKPEVKKTQSIVSMLETAPVEETAKVEKVSKIKPIKIERGNLADEKAKWAELNKKYGKEKALNYKMSDSYPSLVPLQHKVLGWGYILTNENDRLEVLFENGIRVLISNYKS